MSKNELKRILELDKKNILHSYTVQKEYSPFLFKKSNDGYFIDQKNKKYIDFLTFSTIGQGNKKVLSKIINQAKKCCYTFEEANEPKSKLAEKLIKLSRGTFSKVYFSNHGTSAVEGAIKMAKQVTGKYKIISFWKAYHGTSLGAFSYDGSPQNTNDFGPLLPGSIKVPPPYTYRCFLGHEDHEECGKACAEFIEHTIDYNGSDTIAALIAEPVIDGGIVPPTGYWKKVEKILKKNDILLIADENKTGLGRTGEPFGFDLFDTKPALSTVSKGLTSGYLPLAATLASKRIVNYFDDNYLVHGYAYEGHALCCAAGLANMEILEQKQLIKRAKNIGKYYHQKLLELENKHKSIGDVRGIGLLYNIEIVKNRQTKEPFFKDTIKISDLPPSKAIGLVAAKKAFEKGLLIGALRSSSILYLAPPLTITKEQIDEGMSILDKVFLEIDKKCD